MRGIRDDREQVDYAEMPGPSGIKDFTVMERLDSSIGGGGTQPEQQVKKSGWKERFVAWNLKRKGDRRLVEIRGQLSSAAKEEHPQKSIINGSKNQTDEEAYKAALEELKPLMNPSGQEWLPREVVEERLGALRRGESSPVFSKPSRFEQAVMDLVKRYGEEVLNYIYPESELQKRGRMKLEGLREETINKNNNA